MKTGSGIAAWLSLGLFGLLATAPASVAGWLLSDIPFCLIGSRGSLWSGSGWLAGRSGDGASIPLMPLSWSLSWHGRPGIDLKTSEGAATVQPGFTGFHLAMPAFLVDVSSLPLPLTLAGNSPTGSLRGVSGRFDCSYRLSCQGDATLRIENLRLGLFPADLLGDIDIAVHADEQGESARLVPDGRSALSGDAALHRQNGRLTMAGDVRATGSASPGLTRTLASLKSAGIDHLAFGKQWLNGEVQHH